MFSVYRNKNNPIIRSDNNHPWRALAAFNCSPAQYAGKTHLLYRGMTDSTLYNDEKFELSSIGHVVVQSDDYSILGEHKQLVAPEEDWEQYGCEDPRVTQVDDKYYIFYTAVSDFPFKPEGIRVAVAITRDFETIEERHLVTPFNAKAMALFPEKINGKWTVILTANSDMPPSRMVIAQVDEIEDLWSSDFWIEWYKNLDDHEIDLRRLKSDHTEVGAVPIKTDKGWLLIYSHIQDYFTNDKVFGIEAVLLDLEDPRKIIGRTNYPFMVPEESYEQYGQLPNIIFPSGALAKDDKLTIFYGAADTVCAAAEISLGFLLDHIQKPEQDYAQRHVSNPILKPVDNHPWESSYVLNPTAIEIDGAINILYRAIGSDNTSVIGLAISRDGTSIDERLDEPIYVPREDFESKSEPPDGYSGCEDARAVIIDDRIYITYTGFNGSDLPAVAASSISLADFKQRKWDAWTKAELISPPGVDDKDAAIFTEKINNQYMVLHRIDGHVCADLIDNLDFKESKLRRCIQVFGPRKGMWDSEKVGINGPPIKTEAGWLLFYHGITRKRHYDMGAVLLDKDDPTIVIGRSAEPIMEPRLDWELRGWIDNVIFSCGQVVRDETVYIYYGGADSVIGVATVSLSDLIDRLRPAS